VALYQCKDGYVLKGQNTTTCNFGNWSGETPHCDLVYCPFPGYIERGKVLLVGNMGLYDYRPYVRKVMNNRQIVFECGRGYALADGPPGATCIDGRFVISCKQRLRMLWGNTRKLARIERHGALRANEGKLACGIRNSREGSPSHSHEAALRPSPTGLWVLVEFYGRV